MMSQAIMKWLAIKKNNYFKGVSRKAMMEIWLKEEDDGGVVGKTTERPTGTVSIEILITVGLHSR